MRPVFESVLPVPERARQRILELADKEQSGGRSASRRWMSFAKLTRIDLHH
jgi:hypothetical protein